MKIHGIEDRTDENGEIYKVDVLKEKIIPIESSCANFKPITPLQLLRINSGISHPFADRLMEYLTKNAITGDDDISDNIERIQQTMSFAKWTNMAKDPSEEQNKKGILENLSFDQTGL